MTMPTYCNHRAPRRPAHATASPPPWRRLAPLLLALGLALPAAGDETGPAAPPAERPDITIRDELTVEEQLDRAFAPEDAATATKQAAPRRLTPISLSVISDVVLHEQDARILGSALENVAGVTAHRFGGTTDVFYIRGFESLSSALVLTDGALEPEVSTYHTYNLERVEVVRGPAGFLYGGSALAGAINLVRKRPLGQRGGGVQLLGGSYGTVYGAFDYHLGSAGGAHAFRLNALYTDTDGYRDDLGNTSWALNPSYALRASDRTTLYANAEIEDGDLSSDTGLPLLGGAIPEVPRSRSYQSDLDVNERDVLRLRLDLETVYGPRFVLRNKTYLTELDQHSAGTVINGAFVFGPFEPLVARVLAGLDDRQQFLGHQVDALFDLGDGAVRHQLVAGLEVQRLADDFDLGFFNLPPIGLFNPIETARPPLVPIPGSRTTGDVETTVVAPYVLDTIAIGARVKLALGARYDAIEIDDARTGFRGDFDQASPFAALLYAPDQRFAVFANYGRSFSPPSTTVVADGREPEEGEQIELGVKADLLGGRLAASLALYRIDKEKIAIADNTGFLAQQGDQRSQGLELELSGRAGRSTLHWLFSYAYTDAELIEFRESIFNFETFTFDVFDFSGNRPAWVPDQVADLWLSKRFRNGLTVAGGARYVAERFVDEDNAVELDDYVTFDAAFAYTRGGPWTARLHLKNLTGEDYELRSFSSLAVLPAEGFNLQAGIDLRF